MAACWCPLSPLFILALQLQLHLNVVYYLTQNRFSDHFSTPSHFCTHCTFCNYQSQLERQTKDWKLGLKITCHGKMYSFYFSSCLFEVPQPVPGISEKVEVWLTRFVDPENISLATRIVIICQLELYILARLNFQLRNSIRISGQ